MSDSKLPTTRALVIYFALACLVRIAWPGEENLPYRAVSYVIFALISAFAAQRTAP
jgi:hypothetical protein